MRVRSLNRTQQNLNAVFTEYNVKLRRKKTRTQLILKIVFIFALLSFFSGVISGLTGLNSGSAAIASELTPTVVSAQERVNEFNPVKKKKVVVIIIVTDQAETEELLKKLGVQNETQIRN